MTTFSPSSANIAVTHSRWSLTLSAGLGLCLSHQAHAAFIQNKGADAQSVATALANQSTGAKGASASSVNPALLSTVGDIQVSLGVSLLSGNYSVKDGTYRSAAEDIEGLPSEWFAGIQRGKADTDYSGSGVVPSFFVADRISDKVVVGFSITSPWGTKVELDPTYVGRYQNTYIELTSLMLSPKASFDLSDSLTFGAAVDLQLVEGELRSQTDYGAIAFGSAVATGDNAQIQGAAALLTQLDAESIYRGKDLGLGYTLGFQYRLATHSSLGLTYKSRVFHNLQGTTEFKNPAGVTPELDAALNSGPADAKVVTPDILTFGGAFRVSEKLDLYTSLSFVNWSQFDSLRISSNGILVNAERASLTKYDLKNTWGLAVGGKYAFDPVQFPLLFGLSYEQGATIDELRNPSSADGDEITLGLGTSYRWGGHTIDFAFSHSIQTGIDVDYRADAYPLNSSRGSTTASIERDLTKVMLTFSRMI